MPVQELVEAEEEAAGVRDLLQSRQEALAATLGGQYPQLRTTVWQSESSVQAAVQTLTPQMTENKKKVCVRAWSCAPPSRRCRV